MLANIDFDARSSKIIPILVAEDDPDDRLLMSHAFDRVFSLSRIHFVEDGEEVLDYLLYRGRYAGGGHHLPKVILMDLNMPRLDGRETLKTLKADERTRHIPVVVYTTSDSQQDINHCYELGAAGYIVKPATMTGIETALMTVGVYWGDLMALPSWSEESPRFPGQTGP